MAVIQNAFAKGTKIAAFPNYAGAVVAQRFTHSFTTGQLVANNIVEMAPIPPGLVPVDMILDSDDLDTDGTPAVTLDVGIMSGAFGDPAQDRTCGAEFFSGATVGQAGGVARPTLASAFRVAAAQSVRSIGIKVATAPDAAQAGTVGLTVLYAAMS